MTSAHLSRATALLNSRAQSLPPKATAIYLGVAARTLEVWRAKGIGPAYRRVGKKIFYDLPDLDAFIESGKRRP